MHFSSLRGIVPVTLRYLPAIALFASLTAAMTGSASSSAEEPAWALTGPAFSASVGDLQKAAAKIAPEQFMEATVLFERDAYTLDAAGRVTYRHDIVYRIETQAAIEGWSETAERWEPWYQKMPEIHARVIQPDGRVSELDQKTITDGPAKEEDDETYTDARIRKAPLPGLAVGAIVEQETVLEDKSAFFAGGGIYRDFFSRNVPIIHSELVVDAPRELNLQYRVHLLPTLRVTNEEQAGMRHLTFIQENLSAYENSDIRLSTHAFLSSMVEFSTGESWAGVANSYRQLAEPQIDPAKAKVMLPTEAEAGRMETIQRILSRLHKDIRYTGIEFGQASLQPQTADEVIKRHYGDCKDKAALLVALLRAAGIPANLALLDAGPGLDVTPDLPGMNRFDHAIVYVPADPKGGKDGGPLWIDATAQYAQAGTLPSMDQGRLALIIADGTKALTLTPTPRAEDDVLTELRDVTMKEYGLAHITETSLTHGEVDEEYRSEFGSADTREKKANLEKYAKEHYMAKALTGVEHSDGMDFNKPFYLKLDMAEAKRGNAMIDDAAVAIPFSGLFNRLPGWFRTDPKPNGEKPTPQQEEDQKKAVLARASEYDVHPFVNEWRYRITPAAGFVARALPEDKSTDMGPAKLTQHYEMDSQGVITANLRFETGKPEYTVEDALALRDAVMATYKQDMVMILFDQAGAKLMAAGKIREALAADRALIDSHPAEALHHAQIAYALLQAGMGDRARIEAQQATKLDPKSAIAFKALGWVCQFNAIGVQFAHGFDLDCARAAYKRALELEADDTNTALNLAILDEYNHDGERYAEDAFLLDAIHEYKAVTEIDKPTGDQYEDNLLFDLLYSGQFKELLQELEKLPSSVTREGLGISATVALQGGAKGIAAGIERADHSHEGAQQRNAALSTAGNQLVHLRRYAEAAEILSAGIQGQDDAADVTRQVEMFRHLSAWKKDFLPASDPRSVVQHFFLGMLTSGYTESTLGALLSRHAYGTETEWTRNLEKALQSQGQAEMVADRGGLPAGVLIDVIAGNLKLTVEGDDQTGYRVSMDSLGAETQSFFVSKDEGVFKLVSDGKTMSEVGNEVLYLLHGGREAEARSLLDWMRDQLHKGGGDDPLSGPMLPRFWTSGESSGVPAMQLAAASLVAYNTSIEALLPMVEAAREKETKDEARLNLDLLLATGYVQAQNGPAARAAGQKLLDAYPDSNVALGLVGNADVLLKKTGDWDALIDARLKKHPKDELVLRIKVEAAQWEENFPLARATEQQLMDNGKATADDYNNYGWMGLFDGKVDAAGVKAAQQATMLTKSSSYPELHTLACIYAYQGKTTEARELLLKAMSAESLSEPNSAIWYAFGSIYEQYGVNDAAIEAYKKVEKPEGQIDPTNTYLLAETRLKALGAEKN